jgi:hypothetical protein
MILGQLCPFFTTYCLHLPGFPSCGIARKFPTKILKACVSNFRITYLDHYKYLYEQLYYSSAFMTWTVSACIDSIIKVETNNP